jgi:hypothetical protein
MNWIVFLNILCSEALTPNVVVFEDGAFGK